MTSSNKLAEKVRLSLKYEEAKRRFVVSCFAACSLPSV